MRPNTSTVRATSSNAKIIWSGVVLLALLMVLAIGLAQFPLPLQARNATLLGSAQSQPQELVPLDGIAQVASGTFHTCALNTMGGVKCWGYNGAGQLGDGGLENRTIPVDVVGLSSGVTAVATGSHYTCALTTMGGVKCWGYNSSGQLGDGTRTEKITPVNVVGLSSGIASVSAGNDHTCALTTAGGVKCWGIGISG